MPQAPTALMGLIRPTELGDSGIWASLLDTMFAQIDSHDHTTGKGAKLSLLNSVIVGADIPWSSGGNFFAITGIKAVNFQPQPSASMSTYAGALFMNSADNELYWRSSGGALVKFTNGANFNFAAIGAIGGDYSAVNALFDYLTASGTYRARQELGGGVQQFAIVETGGVNLYEFKLHPTVGVPANSVRMRSPAALAATYTVTWPGAVPAATHPVQMDNTGAVTVTGSIAMANNENVTLSGTGDYKHGTKTLQIHGTAFQPITGTPSYAAAVGTTGISVTGAALLVVAPIPLRDGDRLLAIRFYVADSATGPTKVQGSYGKSTSVGGAAITASSAISAGTGANQTLSITGLTDTLVALSSYWLQVATTTGTNLSACYMVEIDYDRP